MNNNHYVPHPVCSICGHYCCYKKGELIEDNSVRNSEEQAEKRDIEGKWEEERHSWQWAFHEQRPGSWNKHTYFRAWPRGKWDQRGNGGAGKLRSLNLGYCGALEHIRVLWKDLKFMQVLYSRVVSLYHSATEILTPPKNPL